MLEFGGNAQRAGSIRTNGDAIIKARLVFKAARYFAGHVVHVASVQISDQGNVRVELFRKGERGLDVNGIENWSLETMLNTLHIP
jgi:hypothetical protein